MASSPNGRPPRPVTQLDEQLARASAEFERLTDGMDPCYRCGCCRRWVAALELLRAAIPRHEHPAPCPPTCLVCNAVDS